MQAAVARSTVCSVAPRRFLNRLAGSSLPADWRPFSPSAASAAASGRRNSGQASQQHRGGGPPFAAASSSGDGGAAHHPHPAHAMDLSAADRAMVRLYMAGCFHYWDQLPDLARDYYAAGASVAQLRGCVRHMVVFAGYGPCLAATLALHKAKLLPEDAPGKVDGPPGNAFELVYGGVTDRVRANMQAADPVLQEWIRLHLYGDLYSSPGLDLRQKQLLTCAFLSEAHMPDQLFGHALAGLRFGNSRDALEEAARLAIDMGPRTSEGRNTVLKTALQNLDMAFAKYVKDMAGAPPSCPEVTIQDPEVSIRIPPLPRLVNAPEPAAGQGGKSSRGGDASVSVGLQAAAGGKAGGGWGTSNVGRPSSLAVDAIAACMEGQRARSGLFFAWDETEEDAAAHAAYEGLQAGPEGELEQGMGDAAEAHG